MLKPAHLDGTLLIASRKAQQLWMIDLASDSVRAKVPTGPGSREIALAPDKARAAVTNFGEDAPGNTVTLVDVKAGRTIKTLELGSGHRPHGIVWPHEHHLFVTSETTRQVLEVDVDSGSILREIPTGEPGSHMLSASADGRRGFVTSLSGVVTILDLERGAAIRNVPTARGAEGTVVSASGELWIAHRIVNRVSVLDAETLESRADLACAGYPLRMGVQGDGNRLLVTCPKRAEVAIFDTEQRSEVVRISFNRLAGAPGILGRIAMRLTRSTPFGLCAHPTQRTGFVSHPKAGKLSLVHLDTGAIVSQRGVCIAPDGMAWSPVVG